MFPSKDNREKAVGIVWADCPICGKRVEVEIDVESIQTAPSYPVSVVNVHGSPSHIIVLFVDSDFQVRGVEAHKMIVAEEVRDPVTLALKEHRTKGKFVDAPKLVTGLEKIRGVEFVDSKGDAIISLHEAGPTIENLLSPSGRIKGRFIVDDHTTKGKLESILTRIFPVLEKAEPLTPTTLRLLLKILEASIETGENLEPASLLHLAESPSILPTIIVKPLMFDAMSSYLLPDDYAAEELATIRAKLDGSYSLLELIEIIEEKELSILHLLQALEKLNAGEAIIFKKRARAMWGPIGRR